MRQGRHAESDHAEQRAMSAVAYCAAAESVVVPQSLLTIEKCHGFGTVKPSLVLEPPNLGVSEDLRQLGEVAVL